MCVLSLFVCLSVPLALSRCTLSYCSDLLMNISYFTSTLSSCMCRQNRFPFHLHAVIMHVQTEQVPISHPRCHHACADRTGSHFTSTLSSCMCRQNRFPFHLHAVIMHVQTEQVPISHPRCHHACADRTGSHFTSTLSSCMCRQNRFPFHLHAVIMHVQTEQVPISPPRCHHACADRTGCFLYTGLPVRLIVHVQTEQVVFYIQGCQSDSSCMCRQNRFLFHLHV